jgi:hypothetical protein
MMYKSILTSALVGGEWSASRPGGLTPWEIAHGFNSIRGWVGPRTGVDDMERRKNLPCRDPNSDLSAVQSAASRKIDCSIPNSMSDRFRNTNSGYFPCHLHSSYMTISSQPRIYYPNIMWHIQIKSSSTTYSFSLLTFLRKKNRVIAREEI